MTRLPRLRVLYTDKAGEWRWKAVAANYRIIAASSEGFRRRRYAAQNAIRSGAPKVLLHAGIDQAVTP